MRNPAQNTRVPAQTPGVKMRRNPSCFCTERALPAGPAYAIMLCDFTRCHSFSGGGRRAGAARDGAGGAAGGAGPHPGGHVPAR